MKFRRGSVADYGADELARKHVNALNDLYERQAAERKEVLVTKEMKRAYSAVINVYGQGHIIAKIQESNEQ
jgi:hypothetical protein